jgi:cell division protein FtsN
MFESSHRSSGSSSANRWLIVAGGGLVILAFVARMLLDIGHTKVSDLAGVLKPDTTSAQMAAPAVVTPEAPDTALAAVVDTPSAPTPTPPAAPVRVANVTPPILKRDTTPPRPATPRTPAPAASATGYAVQIGAFGSEANAAKLRDRASKLGYTATVISQRRGASELYLVRVQGLSSAETARQASDSLAHTLGVKSVVVPPGR